MKRIFLIVVLLVGVWGCQAQKENDKITRQTQVPKGKWQVHKEFDENGNLIKYDSVYVWSSFNGKDLSNTMNLDSIMKSYGVFLGKAHPFNQDSIFSILKQPDAFLNKDFFDDNFFFDNWNSLHNKQIQKQLREMDSLRAIFLKDFYLKKQQHTI